MKNKDKLDELYNAIDPDRNLKTHKEYVDFIKKELWLYRNPKVLKSIQQVIKDVKEGKVTEIKDLDELCTIKETEAQLKDLKNTIILIKDNIPKNYTLNRQREFNGLIRKLAGKVEKMGDQNG